MNTSLTAFSQEVEGVSEGTYVTVVRNSPVTSAKVGADGSVQRTFSPDRTGTITLTLQQNSPTNRYLARIYNAQDLRGEPIYGDFTVLEPAGSFLCIARYVHIIEAPEMSLAKEAEDRTWTLAADQILFAAEAVGSVLSDNELAKIAGGLDAAIQNSESFTGTL